MSALSASAPSRASTFSAKSIQVSALRRLGVIIKDTIQHCIDARNLSALRYNHTLLYGGIDAEPGIAGSRHNRHPDRDRPRRDRGVEGIRQRPDRAARGAAAAAADLAGEHGRLDRAR